LLACSNKLNEILLIQKQIALSLIVLTWKRLALLRSSILKLLFLLCMLKLNLCSICSSQKEALCFLYNLFNKTKLLYFVQKSLGVFGIFYLRHDKRNLLTKMSLS
jgi:hypothetical protein